MQPRGSLAPNGRSLYMEQSAARANIAPLVPVARRDDAPESLPVAPLVLIVEDEMVVAMLIKEMVTGMGCEVGGVAFHLNEGEALLERDSFDLAILDVHLNGKLVFPLADMLARRGIPFMLTTAYDRKGIPERYRDSPMLRKPFSALDLKNAMLQLDR